MLSNLRIAIVVLLFVSTFWGFQAFQSVKEVPVKRPLDQFPQQIGEWNLVDRRLLSNTALKKLGVDDYIDYTYTSPGRPVINLLVSYYKAVGVSGGYHSPKNCLPGGGWNITHIKPLKLDVHHSKNDPAEVNFVIIQKGGEKQAVIYWYQNRGRIIASEYREKIYLVLDSVIKRRRDGSFIRIMTAIADGKYGESDTYLKEFAENVMLILEEYLPGADVN